MGHVFFPRPGHQHGSSGHRPGRVHGRLDEVHLQAPAESSSHVGRVDPHRVQGDVGDAGADALGVRRALVPRPDVQLAILQPRHRIERLHRGVGQVGNVIRTFDDVSACQGLFYVSVVPPRAAIVVSDGVHQDLPVGCVRLRIGRGAPVEVDHPGCLHGIPRVGGDDDDSVLQRNDLAQTG